MLKGIRKIRTYKDFDVYRLAYNLAIQIFQISRDFPKEELYSLTNQICRSSRSIPANICEGWGKRHYKNTFIKYLNDANGSCEETKTWLDFAKDLGYLDPKRYTELINEY